MLWLLIGESGMTKVEISQQVGCQLYRKESVKMKTSSSYRRILGGLFVSLLSMLANEILAQTFTTLHSFTTRVQTDVSFTNSDGIGPDTDLIISGNTLYGTTYYGGTNGWGTVFAINTDGTGFTTLHDFTRGTGALQSAYINLINSDGAQPIGGLVLSGNTLYGTAYYGGMNAAGTVFGLNTDGTGFRTLHSFTALGNFTNIDGDITNADGANPSADLLLAGNTLYGTCYLGGTEGAGTLFAINTDGTGFRVLRSFGTNSHTAAGVCGLVLSSNTLYGAGSGTIFAINTDGTGFTNLHIFGVSGDAAEFEPGRLALSGNTLYGAGYVFVVSSPFGDAGTVWALNTDGTGFRNLHSFTHSDGAEPTGGVILSGNTLYGVCYGGGASDAGTVFAINTDGTGFTTLYTFTGWSDGGNPQAELILSGNTLCGTAYWGGIYGSGTVFSISLPPQLTITPSGSNLILSWPTNFSGYTLQSTTNLASPFWTTNLPTPVVLNVQYTVISPISGSQQFFRLSQ
jgi:uncharacterized repeat protein (TIGR03803 family)